MLRQGAQLNIEVQKQQAQHEVENSKTLDAGKVKLERAWSQMNVAAENQRLLNERQVFEKQKVDAEHMMQTELAKMKAHIQAEMTEQRIAFQEALSMKEAEHIAEK